MPSLMLATLLCLAAASPRPVAVVVGDSITQGEGVPRNLTFVARLGEASPGWEFVSHGRGGWSTASYARQLDRVLPAIPPEAALVVIMLGTNDVRTGTWMVPGTASPSENLEELGLAIQRRAPRARLLIVAPICVVPSRLSARLRDAGYSTEAPARQLVLRDAWRKAATRHGWAFVDLLDVVAPANVPDGVHPDEVGHQQMAEALLPWLGAAP